MPGRKRRWAKRPWAKRLVGEKTGGRKDRLSSNLATIHIGPNVSKWISDANHSLRLPKRRYDLHIQAMGWIGFQRFLRIGRHPLVWDRLGREDCITFFEILGRVDAKQGREVRRPLDAHSLFLAFQCQYQIGRPRIFEGRFGVDNWTGVNIFHRNIKAHANRLRFHTQSVPLTELLAQNCLEGGRVNGQWTQRLG